MRDHTGSGVYVQHGHVEDTPQRSKYANRQEISCLWLPRRKRTTFRGTFGTESYGILLDRTLRWCNAAGVVEVEVRSRSDPDMPITTGHHTLQHVGVKPQPERAADRFRKYGDRTSSFGFCSRYASSVVRASSISNGDRQTRSPLPFHQFVHNPQDGVRRE